MKKVEHRPILPEYINYVLVEHDENGHVFSQREGHNIVVNQGRQWCRDAVNSMYYPPLGADGIPVAGQYPGKLNDDWPIAAAVEPHKMRFVAFGTGGIYGTGSYTETVDVACLEAPVKVRTEEWLQQLIAPGDPADPPDEYSYPSGVEVCYRATIGKNDITYPGGPVEVEITEMALLTSLGDPTVEPKDFEFGIPAVVAYACFKPFKKLSNRAATVFWYWRY